METATMNQELGQEPLIDVSDLKVTIHTYRGDVKAVRGGGYHSASMQVKYSAS
ncbi:hypothetical protein [Bifidobacterium subtile]|uniref:hypothetical protein n=1 Tax=Bifidobacterium subtile TaxID=77635 RepID=UPI000410B5F9|nr:hypothetical protein [Bifidobacterium subtile]